MTSNVGHSCALGESATSNGVVLCWGEYGVFYVVSDVLDDGSFCVYFSYDLVHFRFHSEYGQLGQWDHYGNVGDGSNVKCSFILRVDMLDHENVENTRNCLFSGFNFTSTMMPCAHVFEQEMGDYLIAVALG